MSQQGHSPNPSQSLAEISRVTRNASADIAHGHLSRRRLLKGAGAVGLAVGAAGSAAGAFKPADAYGAGANDGLINVKDSPYGAAGDGKTDDTAAIQAAIVAAGSSGSIVYLPPGVYMIGNRIRIRDGVTIQGAGRFNTRLRLLPSWTGPILDTEDKATYEEGVFDEDFSLLDLTLDGNAENSSNVGEPAAMLHSYNVRRWHIARCRFMHGRGYGVGLQGHPGTGNGPQEDIYFSDCEFDENHYGGVNGTGSIDVKSSARLTMVNCLVRKDGVGFDIRSHFGTFVNCHARECEFGFVFRSAWVYPDQETYVTVLGGSAEGCGAGIAVARNNSPDDPGTTHVTVIDFNSRNNANGIGTANPTPPNTENVISLDVIGGQFSENEGFGIGVVATRNLSIQGAVCRDNGSDGIRVTDTPDATIVGCDLQNNGGWGISLEGSPEATDRSCIVGNVFKGNAEGQFLSSGPNSKVAANSTDQGNGINAGPTITAPASVDVISVVGTVTIGSITASRNGRTIVLEFQNSLKVTNGGNLRLKGDFNATTADTLTLVCHNGLWYEVARSSN